MQEYKRNYSLDFIKIIATIFIIFHHYQQITGAYFHNKINFCNGKFYFGYMVELFFILSGFFMYSYINKIEQGTSFFEFYIKRITRLFPMLLIGAISYEFLLIIYQYIYKSSWFDITPTFWGIIISSLGIQDGWALPNPCVNNPTWYISVLMLCYIIFYFLVYISKRTKIRPQYLFIFMIFLGMGIQTYGINLPFLNNSSSRGYYAFFFGLLLAEFLDKHNITKRDILISILSLTIMTYLIVYHYNFMSSGINYIMTYIYYPMVIILCKSNIIGRLLNRKIIGQLGRISFDVFIWHNPFYLLLYICIKLFNWNLNLNSWITMVGYAVFCYIWGTISYYLIEQPIGKIINKRIKF